MLLPNIGISKDITHAKEDNLIFTLNMTASPVYYTLYSKVYSVYYRLYTIHCIGYIFRKICCL